MGYSYRSVNEGAYVYFPLSYELKGTPVRFTQCLVNDSGDKRAGGHNVSWRPMLDRQLGLTLSEGFFAWTSGGTP